MSEFKFAQNIETKVFYNLGENTLQRKINKEFLKKTFGIQQLLFYDDLSKEKQKEAMKLPNAFDNYNEYLVASIERIEEIKEPKQKQTKETIKLSLNTMLHLNDIKTFLNLKRAKENLKDLNEDEIINFALRTIKAIEEIKF